MRSRSITAVGCGLLCTLAACERPPEVASRPATAEPVEVQASGEPVGPGEPGEPGEPVKTESPETGMDEPDRSPADAEGCVGCEPAADLPAGRIDAFAQAACEKHDYALAFDEFLKLTTTKRDDPRTRAIFAGWLYFAGEREAGRSRIDELNAEPDVALEVAMLRAMVALAEDKCKSAKKHDRRAQILLAGEAGETARPTIWIDFPRALATDTRAVTMFVHGLVQKRCTSERPLTSYEAALAYDPGFALAHTLIGDLYAADDQPADAARAWEAAIAAQPEHAEAYIKLGALRESQCRFEEALALLDRGWQLNPFDKELAPYTLCFAYTRAGRYDEAARACKTYGAANPYKDDADELYMMGNLLIVIPEAPAAVVADMDQASCPAKP